MTEANRGRGRGGRERGRGRMVDPENDPNQRHRDPKDIEIEEQRQRIEELERRLALAENGDPIEEEESDSVAEEEEGDDNPIWNRGRNQGFRPRGQSTPTFGAMGRRIREVELLLAKRMGSKRGQKVTEHDADREARRNQQLRREVIRESNMRDKKKEAIGFVFRDWERGYGCEELFGIEEKEFNKSYELNELFVSEDKSVVWEEYSVLEEDDVKSVVWDEYSDEEGGDDFTEGEKLVVAWDEEPVDATEDTKVVNKVDDALVYDVADYTEEDIVLVDLCSLREDEGLYAVLRIGPYVCAEWNYGGLPVWLHNLPNCELRTSNTVYQNEMQNFTTLIVDMVKQHNLFASQGGPIIKAQIENEYGNIISSYGDAGTSYINRCANLAESYNIGVPWIMCQESDAPQLIINTCNGFCCDQFEPNCPNSPKMWTENWNGWFKNWGGKDPYRMAEDVAFSVARFFQLEGTFQNYYMYHGGTNFGRTTGGPYITTSYDYDAPLNEYGGLNQPKYGHLKEQLVALLNHSDVDDLSPYITDSDLSLYSEEQEEVELTVSSDEDIQDSRTNLFLVGEYDAYGIG